jgi:ankyrin repeat protein
VNQTDENGNTALMFAADKCDRFTLKLLLAAGAKVGLRNKMNLTALQMSIYSGEPAVEELILAGARLDPETAKAYLEGYKDNPKALALVRKAMAK